MQPSTLPIDPIQKVVTQVVWRLTLKERLQLEGIYRMDPVVRIKTVMNTMTLAARRDRKILDLLSAPGVLPELKKMWMEKQQEQQEAAADSDASYQKS